MRSLISGVAALALAACAQTETGSTSAAATAETPAASDGFVRVADEATYREALVGKRLVADWGDTVFAQDGTVTGEADGEPFSGTWRWEDGYVCREIPTVRVPQDCLVVEIGGDKMRGTRDSGAGESFVMTIEG